MTKVTKLVTGTLKGLLSIFMIITVIMMCVTYVDVTCVTVAMAPAWDQFPGACLSLTRRAAGPRAKAANAIIASHCGGPPSSL